MRYSYRDLLPLHFLLDKRYVLAFLTHYKGLFQGILCSSGTIWGGVGVETIGLVTVHPVPGIRHTSGVPVTRSGTGAWVPPPFAGAGVTPVLGPGSRRRRLLGERGRHDACTGQALKITSLARTIPLVRAVSIGWSSSSDDRPHLLLLLLLCVFVCVGHWYY